MKGISIVLALAATAVFLGCQQSASGGDDFNYSMAYQARSGVSLKSMLSGTESVVDLGGSSFAEDADIARAVTVKNGDLGGKRLTVLVSGVVLENIRNATVVVAAGVGDGEFTMKNCSGIGKVTVNGGGANSVHFVNSAISAVSVVKTNVRIALEGATNVARTEVKAGGVMLEGCEASSLAKVSVASGVGSIKVAGGRIGIIVAKASVEIKVLSSSTKIAEVKSAAAVTVSKEAGVVLEADPVVSSNADVSGEYEEVAAENGGKPEARHKVRKTDTGEMYWSQTGEMTSKGIFEYDTNGRLIKGTSYDSQGNLTSLNEYEWDSSGRKMKEISKKPDGTVTSILECEYDSTGREIKMISKAPDGTVTSIFECEYDSAGGRLKTIQKAPDGTVSTIAEYENEYDSAGRVVKEIQKATGVSGTVIIEFDYDSDGDLISANTMVDGKLYQKRSYTYY